MSDEDKTKTQLLKELSEIRQNFDRLNLTMLVSNDGMYDWDVVTNNIYFDSRYYTMAGYEPNEFPGTFDEWAKRVHPEDFERVDKVVHAYMNGEIESYNEKFRFKCKNGKWMWIRARVKIVSRNKRGEPLRVVGTHTDITEEMKLENEIRSSEQHLKLYREQAPMASIEWNTEFQVLNWNKAAEKMFGYTVDEVRGRYFVDVMLPENAIVNVKQIWKDLMAQTGGEISINENLTKDGHIILCEWHNTPLIDESGKVIGAASIVQDITERKQKDEQLRRNQKMEALGKLTGGVTHDYNNMLGIVLGYAELLESMLEDRPELIEYLQEIRRAGDRGANLTKKLLNFSRQSVADAGKVNIGALLKEEQHMLEKTLTARIKLEFNLSDDLWLVYLDSGDLEDAIVNICINAMHAMEGKGQLTIQSSNLQINESEARILNMHEGEYVVLSFTDSGCGMSKEIQEKIFDPFFSTKGNKGTGLGLSQVYGFVERSEGSIKVNSEEGRGTCFTLYFPRYNVVGSDTESEELNDDDDLRGTATILVVDDELALLKLTSKNLSLQGYNVHLAENAKQALDILEHEDIDLLLSDVIMPEMDGYQLAHIVQKQYPAIKIQLTSGFSNDHHANLVGDDLHKNILYKPCDLKTLLLRIRELLDRC